MTDQQNKTEDVSYIWPQAAIDKAREVYFSACDGEELSLSGLLASAQVFMRHSIPFVVPETEYLKVLNNAINTEVRLVTVKHALERVRMILDDPDRKYEYGTDAYFLVQRLRAALIGV